MPNQIKNDENTINDNEKDALHGAGIDLPNTSTPPTKEDVEDEPKDAPEEETIIDMDNNVPPLADPDLTNTGIKFFDETKKINKEDLSSLAEQKMKEARASDLEAEFQSELSPKKTVDDGAKVVLEKGMTMSKLLTKIREKLGLKKNKVKDELGSLKKMKEGISKDISEIKELEESEQKIEAEIKKIDTIKEEMDKIEKEVSEELQK